MSHAKAVNSAFRVKPLQIHVRTETRSQGRLRASDATDKPPSENDGGFNIPRTRNYISDLAHHIK